MTSSTRRALLAMIHAARRTLALDDESYRALLERLTGKRSCGDMTYHELQIVVDHFRAHGAIGQRSGAHFPGGSGEFDNRPTPAQMGTIERLAGAAGYAGLDDARFTRFLRRTTHVDNIRFLDRARASSVISGLVQVTRSQRRSRRPATEGEPTP